MEEPIAYAYYYDGQNDHPNHPIVRRIKSGDPRMRREPWTEVPLYARTEVKTDAKTE